MSTPKYDHRHLGIFGYGSLLTDAGTNIEPHIIARISHPTPWPIEYAGRSTGRGDGPTLVIHPTGGHLVGGVLVLDLQVNHVALVTGWLRERENNPPRHCIKQMPMAGLDVVLYCDLDIKIGEADLNAERLADFAIESARKNPERNGIGYLADNVGRNLITPLTYSYRDAILRKTCARDLAEAEAIASKREG